MAVRINSAILASFLREDGLYVVILALSLNDVLTLLKPTGNGCLIAVSRNDRAIENMSTFLIAVGDTFDKANEVVWNHARDMVERQTPQLVEKPVVIEPHSLEKWYDGFSYCTWNGLGQQLTEEKIFNALETLRDAGIQFSNLIIDDNWQSLDHHRENNFHHRWTEFEADRDAFPHGLKYTISEIRKEHPEIKHIAVWHGILGYWNGISPEGAIAKTYRTKLLRKSGKGFLGEGSLIAVDPADMDRFYDDFYRFLSDCGIDSVKTDTQFLLDQIDDAVDRTNFTTAYQRAWLTASLKYFSSKAISCMSQTPQILFQSQLVKSLPKLMVRNSEDFFPDESESHPWHIFCNAHNNVLTRHLNILPDWDMFQTSHEYSAFHGAARCISGGPIYFTDKPGEHDTKLIKEMTARTLKSGTIILRPNVAKTTNVYSSNDEMGLLKVGTTTIETKTSILGIFNINNCALSELISLHDFEGPQHSQTYIIRAHRTGKMSREITTLQFPTSQFLVELDVKGYEILTLFPLEELYFEKGELRTHFAVLGLLDKMTGAAAVVSTKLHQSEGSLSIEIVIKAFGTLGIYLPALQEGILIVSQIRMCNEEVPVIESVLSEGTMKIDIERVWESMRDGRSKDLEKIIVEVFVKPK